MKILKRIFAVSLCCLICAGVFTGCAYKKYELVGIVKEGESVITPLAELDENTVEYLTANYNCYATIDLKQNNEFIMEYSLSENGLTVTYSQTGRFKLNEKEETITFYTPRGNGDERASTQQYSNNAIIYFDGVYFLAFK